MPEEDLLKSSPEKKPKEGQREGEEVNEASLPELTDADIQQLADETIRAAESTFVEAPGEARETAVEHLGGNTAEAEAVRAGFRQRAGDLRDWVLNKVRRSEPDPSEEPVAAVAEEVIEPTGQTRMFNEVDSVRPPEPSFETGPSLKDELADIIRDHPERFDMLTDTVEDKRWTAEEQAEQTLEQQIADIELKQAALIYELYDLAGYVPGLRNVRDKAIPNIEYARRVINEGKDGTFVNLFTPEQLGAALEKVATRQVKDSTQVFGASFDDWVNKTKETGKTLGKEFIDLPEKEKDVRYVRTLLKTPFRRGAEEASAAAKTLGLSQVWRLAKLTVSVPATSIANMTKASWVLGTRFGSAAMEKLHRRGLKDKDYPNVVKSDELLSRGADTQHKLDRMMEIQQKLHSLRRERTSLMKADTAGTIEKIQAETPETVEDAAEQMVDIQLWQDACDQAFAANDDAAVSRLIQDTRPIEEIFPITADTAEQRKQMLERATTMVRNRPAIRDVCRKYLGNELQRDKHSLSQAGLNALQRGKFLYKSRADGSLEVELLLEPTVKRRRSEYDDEGGFEASDEGGSLHLTIPADMVERLLGEAGSGNYKPDTKILDTEALSRVFETDIVEPPTDTSLNQPNHFDELTAADFEIPCRYREKTVVSLPGKIIGEKDSSQWTIKKARNKLYLLEQQEGKQTVMSENDLASWIALAHKPAKAAA